MSLTLNPQKEEMKKIRAAAHVFTTAPADRNRRSQRLIIVARAAVSTMKAAIRKRTSMVKTAFTASRQSRRPTM